MKPFHEIFLPKGVAVGQEFFHPTSKSNAGVAVIYYDGRASEASEVRAGWFGE
jgi:hypothetical protein